MIEEPEEKDSSSSQKPNSALDQMTISEPRRERCMAQVEAAFRESRKKPRLEEPSIELWETWAKPRSAATESRSISQLTPARAPEPSGITEALSRANWKRRASRASILK